MPQVPQERLIAAVVVFYGSGQLIAGQLACGVPELGRRS
jgi:hypothetical protein